MRTTGDPTTASIPARWLTRLASRLPYRIIRRDADTVLFYRFKLVHTRWLAVYLHQFVNGDWEHMHDHPWWFASLVLSGRYLEKRPQRGARQRGPLSVGIHAPRYQHSIRVPGGTCWTLFLKGPAQRAWGFYEADGRYRQMTGAYEKGWLKPSAGRE